MASAAVEVIYRGIFQKNLAGTICKTIVTAAHRQGKVGTAMSRYGDSPERNGIPAKQFAIVADSPEELEESLAKYEPKATDVSVCLDDNMAKGIESWSWYGIQPINDLVKPGGLLIVTSLRTPEQLLQHIHRREQPYRLAILRAEASLGGLWVYRDDHTDVRVLGMIARLAPSVVSLDALVQTLHDKGLADQPYRGDTAGDARAWEPRQVAGVQPIPIGQTKLESFQQAYEAAVARQVAAGEGAEGIRLSFEKPGWRSMREGVVVDAPKPGIDASIEVFKKWSTRTKRPVINFDTCIKCDLCWLHCPDECFYPTEERLYDVKYESCCGCGVCEEVCPVDRCIVMVDEIEFTDFESPYKKWKRGEPLVAPASAGGARYAGAGAGRGQGGGNDDAEERG
jgi:pyruvate ferredoxin oxidoreductase delta subunit